SVSKYYRKVCDILADEAVSNQNESVLSVIVTSLILIGGQIVLLIVFYIPIFLCISKDRKKLLKLFFHISKEVIGEIYHSMKKKIRDDSFSKNNRTYSETFKVFIWFLIIAMVELVVVGLLVGISLSSILGFEGYAFMIKRAGDTRTALTKMNFLINEYYNDYHGLSV